jgi:hypothetical protein
VWLQKEKVFKMTERDVHQKASILTEPLSRPVVSPDKKTIGRPDSSLKNKAVGRITSSSFAIAWSVIILVFFIFFNQYIAYYEPETIGGISKWTRYPILTEAFVTWLPILVATIIAFIIGHIILIYFDKYIVQETIPAVLNLLVMAAVLSLLFIFPFNFTAIPNTETASILNMFVRIALIGISFALGAGTFVRLIRLIVSLFMRRT